MTIVSAPEGRSDVHSSRGRVAGTIAGVGSSELHVLEVLIQLAGFLSREETGKDSVTSCPGRHHLAAVETNTKGCWKPPAEERGGKNNVMSFPCWVRRLLPDWWQLLKHLLLCTCMFFISWREEMFN